VFTLNRSDYTLFFRLRQRPLDVPFINISKDVFKTFIKEEIRIRNKYFAKEFAKDAEIIKECFDMARIMYDEDSILDEIHRYQRYIFGYLEWKFFIFEKEFFYEKIVDGYNSVKIMIEFYEKKIKK